MRGGEGSRAELSEWHGRGARTRLNSLQEWEVGGGWPINHPKVAFLNLHWERHELQWRTQYSLSLSLSLSLFLSMVLSSSQEGG